MQKIGLFGGTFDPVHLGHMVIAEAVLNELKLEKIYFIPTHKHALKSYKKITPPATRLKLLKLALEKYPYFQISDIELKNDDISYSIETIKKFREYEKLPDSDLYYIIGFDNLNEMHLWKDYQMIFEIANIIVVSRSGDFDDRLVQKYKNKIIMAKSPMIDISSTLIRQNIQKDKKWKSLAPPEVFEYITKNKLYK